jgi:hypothetical protein
MRWRKTEALSSFSSYSSLFHCCRKFTHQVDNWIHFIHALLISSRCVLYLVGNWICQKGNGNDVTIIDTGHCPNKLLNAEIQCVNWTRFNQNAKLVFLSVDCVCISHSVPSTDNTQTVSTPYLHLFGTYDVAYAQFHQDSLGYLKMALLQRRNT